jgi:hypothetical protein
MKAQYLWNLWLVLRALLVCIELMFILTNETEAEEKHVGKIYNKTDKQILVKC